MHTPSCTHTHTHMHTCTRTHAHTCAHAHAHTQSLMHTRTHICITPELDTLDCSQKARARSRENWCSVQLTPHSVTQRAACSECMVCGVQPFSSSVQHAAACGIRHVAACSELCAACGVQRAACMPCNASWHGRGEDSGGVVTYAHSHSHLQNLTERKDSVHVRSHRKTGAESGVQCAACVWHAACSDGAA